MLAFFKIENVNTTIWKIYFTRIFFFRAWRRGSYGSLDVWEHRRMSCDDDPSYSPSKQRKDQGLSGQKITRFHEKLPIWLMYLSIIST